MPSAKCQMLLLPLLTECQFKIGRGISDVDADQIVGKSDFRFQISVLRKSSFFQLRERSRSSRNFFWHSLAADSNAPNSGVLRNLTNSGSVCSAVKEQ